MVQISVHVQPGARRNEVVAFDGRELRVRVTAPPVAGKANEAVLEMLAEALGLRRRQVTLLRGATGRRKLIGIEGMEEHAVRERLARAAAR